MTVNCKDIEGYTPLHFSALHGHLGVAKVLIRKGANANARDKRGIIDIVVRSSCMKQDP